MWWLRRVERPSEWGMIICDSHFPREFLNRFLVSRVFVVDVGVVLWLVGVGVLLGVNRSFVTSPISASVSLGVLLWGVSDPIVMVMLLSVVSGSVRALAALL